MAQNINPTKALQAFEVPRDVYNAIKSAAAKTGVNFTYLLEKAAVESSFDKNAKAPTSSATGLYQFIESTWLNMVKNHGDKYGLGRYADKISDNGKVADPAARREILALRKNPEIASLMAAEFDSGNYAHLSGTVGGKIGSTELYMAHFLGANGASGFLNAMKKSPDMAAADLFPSEARANRSVFYDARTGTPRSLRQVYAAFDAKFESTTVFGNGKTTMTAQNGLRLNDGSMTAANDLRLNGDERTAARAARRVEDDPFARLAGLMGTGDTARPSMLRVSDVSDTARQWQIFPPSLYSKLSLSPAQLMMLSDFNA